MDSKDWEMLKIINEEKSLSKAAQKSYLSQPSLTYRLKKLEKEFNVTILNRYSNGVTFTPEGDFILNYALEMLQQMENAKKVVQSINSSIAGRVRIGVSTVYAKFKLAHTLKEYTEHFKDVEVVLKTGSSTLELPQMLKDGEVDLIIKRGDMEWNENKHILLKEPKGIISSKPICLETLLNEPMIQYHSLTITESDKQFVKWWEDQFGVSPDPKVIKVNSMEACIEIVSQGLGWTFLPKIHVKNRKSIYFYPLIDINGAPVIQETVLLYRKKALESIAVKKFIEYILIDCLNN